MGIKIRSGCLTPTFLGAQKWAKWLHNLPFWGCPTRGQNQKGMTLPKMAPKFYCLRQCTSKRG